MILKQLDICCDGVARRRPPNELKIICDAIYKYMNKANKKMLNHIKEELKNKSWVLCENKFYSIDKIFINLPKELKGSDSLIVELPIEYRNENFDRLFKIMGVQDEIGVKDLIWIIKNMVKGDENRNLSNIEVKKVIQILEQISKIQKDLESKGKDPEEMNGLLVPSTENKLVNLQEIQFDDIKDRIDEKEKMKYKITHHLVNQYIAEGLKLETLTGKIYGNYNIL